MLNMLVGSSYIHKGDRIFVLFTEKKLDSTQYNMCDAIKMIIDGSAKIQSGRVTETFIGGTMQPSGNELFSDHFKFITNSGECYATNWITIMGNTLVFKEDTLMSGINEYVALGEFEIEQLQEDNKKLSVLINLSDKDRVLSQENSDTFTVGDSVFLLPGDVKTIAEAIDLYLETGKLPEKVEVIEIRTIVVDKNKKITYQYTFKTKDGVLKNTEDEDFQYGYTLISQLDFEKFVISRYSLNEDKIRRIKAENKLLLSKMSKIKFIGV